MRFSFRSFQNFNEIKTHRRNHLTPREKKTKVTSVHDLVQQMYHGDDYETVTFSSLDRTRSYSRKTPYPLHSSLDEMRKQATTPTFKADQVIADILHRSGNPRPYAIPGGDTDPDSFIF